jgi:hypothetical protein
MEPREVEEWVAAVVGRLRPALLAQAMVWHRLRRGAPRPDEVAAAIAAEILRRLRDKGGPDD